VVQDAGGGHEGLPADATTGISGTLTGTLKSCLEASASWASSDYMDIYFGASAKQSAKSGLAPAYREGRSISGSSTTPLTVPLSTTRRLRISSFADFL
jgi:outer membrane scaffolding protein for murein synthesis (MipA/OmpV family)